MKKLILPAIFMASCITGSAQTQVISGDFNGDGKITAEDVTHLVNVALGKEEPTVIFVDPYNGHEYVDLGLTDADGKPVYWATCNVGADNPWEFGGYYAWGETKTYGEEDVSNEHNYQTMGTYCKTDYNWSTYKYADGTDWKSITKYTFDDEKTEGCWYDNGTFVGDNKTELDPEDDAAHVNWGGVWRMPTMAEQEQLKSQCYWQWVESYNGQDVTGYVVYKAKADSDRGKYPHYDPSSSSYVVPTTEATYSIASDAHIFLPVAGFRYDSKLGFVTSGYYWACTLNENRSKSADCLSIGSFLVSRSNGDRTYGRSVRPVCQ